MRLRRPALAVLAACGVLGGGPAAGWAESICAVVSTDGEAVGSRSLGDCVPTSFAVHCRIVDGGFDPAAHVYVEVCVPR